MIQFSEMSKNENENIKQKNCNFNSIFQIVKCILRIVIFLQNHCLQIDHVQNIKNFVHNNEKSTQH